LGEVTTRPSSASRFNASRRGVRETCSEAQSSRLPHTNITNESYLMVKARKEIGSITQ
jgi:hypothetical protein